MAYNRKIAEERIRLWWTENESDNLTPAELNLENLGLTELPDIPLNCTDLKCSKNKLTKLPPLPNCVILECADNNLRSLPNLPKCVELYCGMNKLQELPSLPNCEILDCFDNELTRLPYTPKLRTLYCYGNDYIYVRPPKIDTITLNYKYGINYNKKAIIIQRTFKRYKQKMVYGELIQIYNKNICGLVAMYI